MNRFKMASHCIKNSIRHPRTQITVNGNPGFKSSPIPWWGSIGVLIIGVASWCIAAQLNIPGLDEAGRAMVYLPLGNIFGMAFWVNK